jgi:8-oxo-dGTP pyrophosphatase MutT (NUDIX family)
MEMKSPRSPSNRQVAALPITIGKDGQPYILLVTSRETKRWVIPKGWPSKKLTDPQAAAREAREEAGVTGKIDRKPVGTYTYRKVLPNSSRFIDVDVYPLWVKKQHNNWQEKTERTRIWAKLEEAAKLVREPGLRALFIELANETKGVSLVSIGQEKERSMK